MQEQSICCQSATGKVCQICGQILRDNSWAVPQLKADELKSKTEILPELKALNICDAARVRATQLFREAVRNKTRRCAVRRGIIYSCLVVACKELDLVFHPDIFAKQLNVKRSNINAGNSTVTAALPNVSTSITVPDVLRSMMKLLGVDFKHYAELCAMYETYRPRIVKFRSCRPNTIASSILHYWLRNKLEDFDSAFFFEKCSVASDTVKQLDAEIAAHTQS